VLHIFSPAQKSKYETKRKNYALLLRSKFKITKIEHNYNSSTKHSYNTLQRSRLRSIRLVWVTAVALQLLHYKTVMFVQEISECQVPLQKCKDPLAYRRLKFAFLVTVLLPHQAFHY